MDLDTNLAVNLLCGLAILVGIVGIIIPMLPGLMLCWLGVLVWALFADGGWGRWLVLAVVTVVVLAGVAVKYLWPGKNLKTAGVPNRSLFLGGLFGLIGFFVIPVAGLVIGFVLGILLAERLRLSTMAEAWVSTKHALKAVGLAMLIELGAGLTIAIIWGVGRTLV